jgi:plastocyanin
LATSPAARALRAAFGGVLLACLFTASARADAGGELRGKVQLGVANLPLAAVAPVVVYLEALGAPDVASPPVKAIARMRQRDAHFSPPFLVVAAGQSVEMSNDDAIYHNVFSYSHPNDFDLGLYPAGESRTLALRHPGVVKLYCSIHESMNATILVAPTRWYDVVDAKGGYALTGIRPGRYRAVVWTERLPATERVIEIGEGERRVLDWVIGKPG